MHIVFVGHSAELMGAERSLLATVREAARRHRVSVILPADGPLRGALAGAGAAVVTLPSRPWMGRRHNVVVGVVRLAQALLSVPRYRRYLARARPDLVVTNSAVAPAGAVAARTLGIRHVWMVRESILTNPTLRSALPRRFIARAIGRWADGVVTVSDYVGAQLLSAAPAAAAKARTIPPPVDPVTPAGSVGSVARPGGTGALRRVLLLGRYTPEKGQRDAIEALASCARRGCAIRLRLAGVDSHGTGTGGTGTGGTGTGGTGTGGARAALGKLARRHGVEHLVEIVPWTDDTPALYAWTDATLMLSRNEAYGRVTVESLMCGTPVIGYRAGATTEILADGGGVLVEPDSEALAVCMAGLAADPASYGKVRGEAERRQRELAAAPSSAAALVDYFEGFRAAVR